MKLLAVAREQGLSSPEDIEAIVLEGGGDIAIIPRQVEALSARLLTDLRDAGVWISTTPVLKALAVELPENAYRPCDPCRAWTSRRLASAA